jgi:transposase
MMSDEPQALRLCILPLLPSTRVVCLTGMTIDGEDILLQLMTTTPSAGCPRCAVPSSSVHSRYQRHLTDVPWGSRPVRLQLTVRKFA